MAKQSTKTTQRVIPATNRPAPTGDDMLQIIPSNQPFDRITNINADGDAECVFTTMPKSPAPGAVADAYVIRTLFVFPADAKDTATKLWAVRALIVDTQAKFRRMFNNDKATDAAREAREACVKRSTWARIVVESPDLPGGDPAKRADADKRAMLRTIATLRASGQKDLADTLAKALNA